MGLILDTSGQPFDLTQARCHARLWADLETRGLMLSVLLQSIDFHLRDVGIDPPQLCDAEPRIDLLLGTSIKFGVPLGEHLDHQVWGASRSGFRQVAKPVVGEEEKVGLNDVDVAEVNVEGREI